MGEGAKFKIRVGVVVIKNQQILLVRQNNRPFWVLPGGTLEPGETLAQCAVREIQEEANLSVRIDRMLYIADFMNPAHDFKKQSLDVFFLAKDVSGDLQMETTENLNEIRFFSLSEAKSMDIQPKVGVEKILSDWEEHFQSVVQNPYLGGYQP